MVIFLTLIYVLIFKSIGYFISSIIYVLCLMFLFEEESGFKKKKLLNILFTVIIVALIYILYQKIFGVRLPIGEVF
jgi:putative tricarboxylic transport membrane protein